MLGALLELIDVRLETTSDYRVVDCLLCMRSSWSESAASVYSGNSQPTARLLGRGSQIASKRIEILREVIPDLPTSRELANANYPRLSSL